MTGGEVQIRFTSTDYPIINSESISIPLNATPEQLKSLVEGLVQSKLGQGSNEKNIAAGDFVPSQNGRSSESE